jgi:hypothetical protein
MQLRMLSFLALTWLVSTGERRANDLSIVVTGKDSIAVRVIWRPYAGAVVSRGEDQQAALRRRHSITHPDSIRRWTEPDARDSILFCLPGELYVDMGGGPIVVEASQSDSLHVEAQLAPPRGQVVSAWGHSLLIESDGIRPYVTRLR